MVTSVVDPAVTDEPALVDAELCSIATGLAMALRRDAADLPTPVRRQWRRLISTDAFDAWVIHWPEGGSVDPHDHGGSTGAVAVVQGELTEVRPTGERLVVEQLVPGDAHLVPTGTVHDIVNRASSRGGQRPRLLAAVVDHGLLRAGWHGPAGGRGGTRTAGLARGDRRNGGHCVSEEEAQIDRMLARARVEIAPRVQPADLVSVWKAGGLVVDTRPVELRQRDGEIPGAIVVDRNVLEWRLDPTSANRIAGVTGPDQRIVIVCDEGYASSLSAVTLRRLGLRRATDLDGGFQAWRRLQG